MSLRTRLVVASKRLRRLADIKSGIFTSKQQFVDLMEERFVGHLQIHNLEDIDVDKFLEPPSAIAFRAGKQPKEIVIAQAETYLNKPYRAIPAYVARELLMKWCKGDVNALQDLNETWEEEGAAWEENDLILFTEVSNDIRVDLMLLENFEYEERRIEMVNNQLTNLSHETAGEEWKNKKQDMKTMGEEWKQGKQSSLKDSLKRTSAKLRKVAQTDQPRYVCEIILFDEKLFNEQKHDTASLEQLIPRDEREPHGSRKHHDRPLGRQIAKGKDEKKLFTKVVDRLIEGRSGFENTPHEEYNKALIARLSSLQFENPTRVFPNGEKLYLFNDNEGLMIRRIQDQDPLWYIALIESKQSNHCRVLNQAKGKDAQEAFDNLRASVSSISQSILSTPSFPEQSLSAKGSKMWQLSDTTALLLQPHKQIVQSDILAVPKILHPQIFPA